MIEKMSPRLDKRSHMKDKNVSYKTNADLKSKRHFLCSRNVGEKSFTSYCKPLYPQKYAFSDYHEGDQLKCFFMHFEV